VKAEIYLVFLAHLVECFTDKVFFEKNLGAVDQTTGLVIDGGVSTEVVFHMHTLTLTIGPHVSALNVIFIEENYRQIVLLTQLN